jgi:hypothetical protein
MNLEMIGVDGDGRVLQVDRNLDRTVFLSRRESEQRMLVEPEVRADLIQNLRVGHAAIL